MGGPSQSSPQKFLSSSFNRPEITQVELEEYAFLAGLCLQLLDRLLGLFLAPSREVDFRIVIQERLVLGTHFFR